MAEVESAIRSESDEETVSSSEPRLSWDPSVTAVPLGSRLGLRSHASSTGSVRARPTSWSRPRAGPAGGWHGSIAACRFTTRRRPSVFDAGRHEPSLDGLSFLCPLDNDRTSRFDLVALDHSGLVHLPNEGTSEQPAFGPRVPMGLGIDLGIAHGQVVQMTSVDWDQDGLADLLVGVHDLTGYWPDSGLLPPAQQVGLNQRAGHPGYDRDGLWRGRAPVGRIYWLRNVGRRGAPEYELQPEITGETGPLDIGLHPAPLAVSWGGRGSTELLMSDHRGLLHVYRNFGGQLPPVLMEPRTLQCGGAHLVLHDDRVAIAMGDIDGDRQAELVYGTSTGRLFAIHAGPTRNDARNPSLLLHQATDVLLGGHASICACDLDGDGDLDIVYGDGPGRLYFLQDLGSGDDHRYALPVPIEAGGAVLRIEPGPDGMLLGPVGHTLGFSRPAVADWLEHDRPDLIVSGAGGDVVILANDGSRTEPRFAHPVPLRCEGAPLILSPRVQPAVARWSSADTLELIGLDLQGFLCGYPKSGRIRGRAACTDRRPPGAADPAGRQFRTLGPLRPLGRALDRPRPGGPARRPRPRQPARGPRDHGDSARVSESLPTLLLLENLGRGVVVPRPLMFRDGRPVVIGQEGCSPRGSAATAGTCRTCWSVAMMGP